MTTIREEIKPESAQETLILSVLKALVLLHGPDLTLTMEQIREAARVPVNFDKDAQGVRLYYKLSDLSTVKNGAASKPILTVKQALPQFTPDQIPAEQSNDLMLALIALCQKEKNNSIQIPAEAINKAAASSLMVEVDQKGFRCSAHVRNKRGN